MMKTVYDVQVPSSRAAAETTLLAFRKSPQPIQACQYILGKEFCIFFNVC